MYIGYWTLNKYYYYNNTMFTTLFIDFNLFTPNSTTSFISLPHYVRNPLLTIPVCQHFWLCYFLTAHSTPKHHHHRALFYDLPVVGAQLPMYVIMSLFLFDSDHNFFHSCYFYIQIIATHPFNPYTPHTQLHRLHPLTPVHAIGK